MAKAIPIEQVFDGSVDNILAIYDQANDLQRESGENWYVNAYMISQDLADQYDLNPDNVAGALAALSPCLDWYSNVIAVREVVESGYSSYQTGLNNLKAKRILDGESPLDVLGGNKVRSFYGAIVEPHGEGWACVDRHAASIFVGYKLTDKQLGSMGRKNAYEMISEAYADAAKLRGISVHELQAVTWVVWRNLHDVDRKIGKGVA